jgi:hypothetical protein
MPTIERTISLGNILTIITIVVGGFGFVLNYSERLVVVEQAQASGTIQDAHFQIYVKEVLNEIKRDVRELREKK